jgi:hypothetical protein
MIQRDILDMYRVGLSFALSTWQTISTPFVMCAQSASVPTEQIEQTLCGFIRREGTVTFSSLANMYPEYRWITLFKALHNLEKHHIVTMTPLRWDYEISAQCSAPAEPLS